MKNLAIILAIILVALTVMSFNGCAETKEQRTTETTFVEEEDEYLIGLAEKANSYAEVFNILKQNSTESFQMLLCKCKNKIVQEVLLNYENLSSDALLWICENPNVRNIDNSKTEQSYLNAILKAEITPDEQLKIAKTNMYITQYSLLKRYDLTAETLIYILEFNNTINWTLNINQNVIRHMIFNQIINVQLSLEEKKQLENLDISIVDKALKERERKEIS